MKHLIDLAFKVFVALTFGLLAMFSLVVIALLMWDTWFIDRADDMWKSIWGKPLD